MLITLFWILNPMIYLFSFYIEQLYYEDWLIPFSLAALVQLFLSVLLFSKLGKGFFNLINLFILFTFVTHLGMQFIFAFKVKVAIPWSPLDLMSVELFMKSCGTALRFQIILAMGIFFKLFIDREKKVYNEESNRQGKNLETNLKKIRLFGIILLLIGLIPMLYLDYNRIILYINGNYLNTYSGNSFGFITTISRFAEIGIIMLLIGNKNNIGKANLIIVITILYQMMVIFTGHRGRSVLFLLSIFFVYFNLIKTIKFKTVLIGTISSYLFLFILTFIGKIRLLSIKDFNSISLAFSTHLSDFTIFKLFTDFGITIVTLGYAIDFYPDNMPYQLGLTYIMSLFTVFPNIGGFIEPFLEKANFVLNWPLHMRTGLGGSYLGEIYSNFGLFSYAIVFILGYFIAYISQKIYETIRLHEYSKLSFYLVIFPNLLWWTRDYFTGFVREVIWIGVAILFLNIIFKSKVRKEME